MVCGPITINNVIPELQSETRHLETIVDEIVDAKLMILLMDEGC